jgi:tRNA A37 threonylcarbamoyladenosine synthetase subunit TsaC/SUA5/YrdC
MKIISLNDFLQQQDFYISEAEAGKIFVYPTDTVYGIGAVHTPENVEKIFVIKQRDIKKMFSIIAPNFGRIAENFPQADIGKMKEQLNEYH